MSYQHTTEPCDILLVGVNVGYIHSSFAPRCLLANLGSLQSRARIIETDTRETTPEQFIERLLLHRPAVIGFSVYIWNVSFVTATLKLLRLVAPETALILGGPQFVPGIDQTELHDLADAVVCGEAEGIIESLCQRLLTDERKLGTIVPSLPVLSEVELPYSLYTDDDLAHRVVYAETTRGCPFACTYCTSSESGGIRYFDLDRLLPQLHDLLQRGARAFKFLDRSFNLGGEHALTVLDFMLEHWRDDLTLHFEFTPGKISPAWRERLLRFPPHGLHLEVGIQTWDAAVAKRIRRPFDAEIATETLRFLTDEAGADVHADLIVGLPGEGSESFAAGFDRLVRLKPAELQVGILKLLPGTALANDVAEFDLRFAPDPPYEILATSVIPFMQMRRLARFARTWDLLYNRQRFNHTAALIRGDAASPFERVMAIADWLHENYGRLHALAPKQIAVAIEATTPPDKIRAIRQALETDHRQHARRGS